MPSWFSNVEVLWESPMVARFLERSSSFSRLILFDRRGSGLVAYPSKRYQSAWIGIVVHRGQTVFITLAVLGLVV